MKRGQPLRRTGSIKAHPKTRRRAHPDDVPKALANRLEPKDETPIIDDDHRDLVKRQSCIVSGFNEGSGEPYCICHHPRELFLRTGGKRISDFLCVSLRPDLHDGYGHSLHRAGDAESWWDYAMIPKKNVFRWIRQFLLAHYPKDHPGVRQAFAKMASEERTKS